MGGAGESGRLLPFLVASGGIFGLGPAAGVRALGQLEATGEPS